MNKLKRIQEAIKQDQIYWEHRKEENTEKMFDLLYDGAILSLDALYKKVNFIINEGGK